MAGTSTSDRTCLVLPWTRQFGSNATDKTSGVAVDAAGNVLVAGYTSGTLPGQSSAGAIDAFVRKYDALGTEVWTRQFGTIAGDFAQGVAVDATGNVLVVGYTSGALPGQSNAGIFDVFVRKYDASGTVVWTRQFGSSNADYGVAVAVDAAGNVLVTGNTDGTLPSQSNAGSFDVFIRKYDDVGTVVWTRQFGTSAYDSGVGVAIDANGNVMLAGLSNGTLLGQVNAGDFDAFVRKYDSSGTEVWTRQFGSIAGDFAYGLAVDGTGNVLVGGYTTGTLPSQTSIGASDAFVRKYDASGTEVWTRQFGSTNGDTATAVAADVAGNVLLAGHTSGTLTGQSSAGGDDAYVRKYDASGAEVWTRQFGSSSADYCSGAAVDAAGNMVVAGYTLGTLPGQSSAGLEDAFVKLP